MRFKVTLGFELFLVAIDRSLFFKQRILLRHGVQKLLQTIVKSRRHCRRSRFHSNESAIGFIHGFVSLMSRSDMLEHFADHLQRGNNESINDANVQEC